MTSPIRHHEVAARLAAIAARSDRMCIAPYGRSLEERELWRVIVSSPDHLAALDADQPVSAATIWLGYGIHGSELSPSDAAMQLVEWLATDDAAEVGEICAALVVHIDIMANPDGRERSLSHLESFRGATANPDLQALHNQVPWPKGRGNHYLFDLNRDAMFGVQHEARLRIAAIRAASPHLYLDAHEMAAEDSFLFACPAEPFNPRLAPAIHESWAELRREIGAALDSAGITHYTGAWNEVFFPGFFDIWPAYHGAVPILLEQATTFGGTIDLPNGRQRGFADAVAAQLCASRAMLRAAARRADTYMARWQSVREAPVAERYWIVDETGPKRDRIVDLLQLHGIAFSHLAEPVRADALHDHWSADAQGVELKSGALLIAARQPLGALVANLFDFHMPMTADFVKAERRRLDLDQKTQLYDCTAWAVSMAYDARIFWADTMPAGDWRAAAPDGAIPRDARAGFGYRYDDPSLATTAGLLERGLTVRLSSNATDRPFLVRREDQGDAFLADYCSLAARDDMLALDRSLDDDGLDPGGDDFALLRRPSIALLTGEGMDAPSTGALWHLFDKVLGIPVSLIDIDRIARHDLRRYDVILAGHAENMREGWLDQRWIENGGTLIAMAGAARSLARSGAFGLTLEPFGDRGAGAESGDHAIAVSSAARRFLPADYPIWNGESRGGHAARYLPRGCYLRANATPGHWLTHGIGDRIPVLFREDGVIRAGAGADVVMRFADAGNLPLSGMIWPEAVEMIAGSPCLIRERLGRGQIVSFAWDPVFRGYSLGTQRLLLNAALLGPAFAER